MSQGCISIVRRVHRLPEAAVIVHIETPALAYHDDEHEDIAFCYSSRATPSPCTSAPVGGSRSHLH